MCNIEMLKGRMYVWAKYLIFFIAFVTHNLKEINVYKISAVLNRFFFSLLPSIAEHRSKYRLSKSNESISNYLSFFCSEPISIS